MSGPRRRGLVGLALGLLLLLPAPARGNGKFPAAGQIVVDPGDAQRILVRTTFGILTSADGGQRFDWICEKGAGYGGGYDPGIAIAAGGTILAGVPDGLSVGRAGGCAWAHAEGGVGQAFVTDVSVQKGHPETAVALRQGSGSGDSVWISKDSGATWAKAGVDLPSDFRGVTLDLAPSDPARLYVSGTRSSGGVLRGAVARSKDGASTWEVLELPALLGVAIPYLGAVDPGDASVIYARLDGTPGKLLVSKDAGETWVKALEVPGFLKAFALSPDGAMALAGGPSDGLWRASTQALSFQKVSSLAATCLAWEGERVYACADQVLVSRSLDQGASFSPLLSLQCVGGPLGCDPATSVGAVCPGMWAPIAEQIGAQYCAGPAGALDAGPDASMEADAGALPDDGGAGGGGGVPPTAGGCGGCGVGRGGVGAAGAIGALMVALLLARGRLRSSSRCAQRSADRAACGPR